MLKHNGWAMRSLLETCRKLTSEQFTQHFEIGPGSLHGCLLHIIGAMQRWAQRIEDRPLTPSPEDDGRERSIDELLKMLDDADCDLRAVAERISQAHRLDEMMEFHSPSRTEPFVFTRGTAIIHVLTHGVHHRAQALNMLRQLGMKEIPEVDAIEWELTDREHHAS